MISYRAILACILLVTVVQSLRMATGSGHQMALHEDGFTRKEAHQTFQLINRSSDLNKQFINQAGKPYDHTMGKGAFWLHNDNDGITDYRQKGAKAFTYFDHSFERIQTDKDLRTGSVSFADQPNELSNTQIKFEPSVIKPLPEVKLDAVKDLIFKELRPSDLFPNMAAAKSKTGSKDD